MVIVFDPLINIVIIFILKKYKVRKNGIVFVHGIVGNNKIFESIKPLVPNTYELREIVLQGHGGNALDFSRASMNAWKKQVEECVNELSLNCDMVVGVGHSMGCLLMIDQAAKGCVSSLFLMNPPLRIKPKLNMVTNAAKVVTGHTDSEVAKAAKDSYGISLDFNPFHYYGWPARYLELFKESRRIRQHVLSKVKCPVKVMLSRDDEMVSISSGNYFKDMTNVKLIELPHSTHYYYSAADKDMISKEFEDLITTTM